MDKLCAVEGCGGAVRAKGKCRRHYQQAYYQTNKEKLLAQANEYYQANREAIVAEKRTYRKTHKGLVKARQKVYYDANKQELRARQKAYYEANKEAISARQRAYYQENKEDMDARKRAYHAANPERKRLMSQRRRARKNAAEGDLSADHIIAMYEDQQGLCAYCETPLFGNYDVDHMVPLSRGGSNDWSNIAIACPSCNRTKNAKTPEEFVAYLA